ncbi:hypothetical protein KBD20_02025 [Candidatus Saccharibacteria bacterium]|nr:hypothetical protein [Candidatus Saccharibacteria bacterium]
MNKITVVTGNSKKLWQAQTVFEPMGITADGEDVPIHEIQSPDGDIHGVEIAREKAKAAFEVLARPLIVCDQYWEIPALGGFPGPYMKDMDEYLEVEDILAMMACKDNRVINLYENVVYTDGEVIKDFTAVYPGTLATEARGGGQPSGRLIIYDGTDLTIAEHRERGEHARDMEQSAWKMFGEWYVNKPMQTSGGKDGCE